MNQEPPAPGTRIGAFTCDRLLGQGGFAWVYAARRDDGKSLALKVLKPRYANDPAFESRFRLESAFAAELCGTRTSSKEKKITVRPYRPVLPGHIWCGVEDKK